MNLKDQIAKLRAEIVGTEVAESELQNYSVNSNEVEHTTNTGYGKELVAVDVLTDKIYKNIPQYARIFDKLAGTFHGNNMGVSQKVAVVGEVGFPKGNSEWTTGAGTIAQGKNLLGTGDVTINQAPLIVSVDISKKLKNHAIGDVEAFVVDELSKSFARGMDSMLINGDTTNTSTGNVNCDDAVPSATFADGANDHRLLINNGVRKLALSGTVNVDYIDVGTLEFADFINVRSLLGNYSYDLEGLLLLMNGATYNKTLTIDDFKDQYKNGINSTITTGRLLNTLAGVEYVVCRDFGLTEADGKQSATPASNTKGGFAYIVKQAVQWGFGQPIEIDIVKVPGKGYSVIGTMEFGFTIVQRKAGETSPSVSLGINATV